MYEKFTQYTLGGKPVETNFFVESETPSAEIRKIIVEQTDFVGSNKYDNTRYVANLERRIGHKIKTIRITSKDVQFETA